MISNARFKLFLLLALVFLAACNQSPKDRPVVKTADDDPYATTVHISEINYFPDTKQFYTELYLLPDFEESVEAVAALLDSVVVEKQNMKRTSFPLEKARKYFMLSDMDSVYIYQTNHVLVGHVPLSRVEYLEDKFGSRFIAVYNAKALTGEPAERYYCISRQLPEFEIAGFKYSAVNNPSLNDYLVHRLNLKGVKPVVKNISIMPMGSTYSIVTTRSESILTETKDMQFNVLKNMNARYRIEDVIPLPIEFNGKPLLLAALYIPGEPKEPLTLAMFTEYQEYRFLNYNRLRLKSIGREVHFDHKR